MIFDVGYSHWLLCRAVGGQHYDLGAGRIDALAFQPLADIDEATERRWAAEWIEMLLQLQGVAVTPQHRLRIVRALDLVAGELRPFRTLTEFIVQLQDRELATALRPYTVEGPYGRLLDADTEALGPGRYQVFELKHLLEMDDKIVVPMLWYLFHRVDRQLDGSPTIIDIEEGWAAFLRTTFENRLRQWLLTKRKDNAAILFVAHSLAQLDAVRAKQVIIESCPTRILLPNAEAARAVNVPLYRELGLNDREIALLAAAAPKRDYYIASPLGRRLITLDVGPIALAFLGAPPGMTLDAMRPAVEALIATHGDDWPAAWLDRLGLARPTDACVAPPDDAAGEASPIRTPRTSPSPEDALHVTDERYTL